MHNRRFGATLAVGAASALVLAGCGGNGSSSDGATGSGGSSGAKGQTLTVWYMHGDYSPETMKAMKKKFEQETGATVKMQQQQWNGITTKVTTALASDDPPDVIDMGNTQVASYAAEGALMDLTSHKTELQQGQTWLGGLQDPATIDGKLYGMPGFAGARAVVYNKKIWQKAGVTKAPTSFDQLVTDLKKIKAQNPDPDFSAMYFPGQFWYAGLQFVWDAGGDIATQKDGKWVGGFSTPEAQKGLKAFKEFQNQFSSKASQTLDTDKPPADTIFAQGKAASFIETNAYIDIVLKDNPKLKKSDLGTFPMPGKSGENQPVMLGGSDWAVAAKSSKQDLALKWLKVAGSPAIQNNWVFGHDKWIPNSKEGAKQAGQKVPQLQKAFFTASLNSKATPASSSWTEIEGTKAINHLFSDIASGKKSVEQAAKDFDTLLDSTLNAS